jgi:hypothetical protein
VAQPLIVALPPGLSLGGGCTITVTALDPSTGNVVAGVNVSNVTIEVDQTMGSEGDLESGAFMLVPGPRG